MAECVKVDLFYPRVLKSSRYSLSLFLEVFSHRVGVRVEYVRVIIFW